MPFPVLRVARPTADFAPVLRFYCDGLGFERIGGFEGHDGYDGLILGHPGAPYHLEFTRQAGHPVEGSPSPEHLLVLYLPDAAEWRSAVERMEAAGYGAVGSQNPYWDRAGRTFVDPDGYRVVLQNTAWAL
jgi:catechol 2,3-dioxygenase-like lactoylglutathione lyase family enzyme